MSTITVISLVAAASPAFASYVVDSGYSGVENRLFYVAPSPTVTASTNPIVNNNQLNNKVSPTVPKAVYTTSKSSYGSPQALAAQLVSPGQLGCFDFIIGKESGWDVHATNPSSGAYGLPQALPGSKMASEGADWQDNPLTQLKWALKYMNGRYGSPCGAAAFWQAHGWY